MGQVIQAEQFWRGQKPPFNPPPPPPPMDTSERLAKIEAVLPSLATKEEMHEGFGELRTEMHKGFGELRTDMHKEFNAQSWRIFGALVTICGLLAAAVFFIARNVK